MLTLLNRLLLVVAAVALVASVYIVQTNMTQINFGHDTFYTTKWPWLHQVREVCFFAVLGWCLLFLKSEPTFARIGIVSVIAAMVIMNLSPRLTKELPKELPAFPIHH